MINSCISPPWFTLRNNLACTIGNDPCIHVSELIEVTTKCYLITIYAKNHCSALALRKILPYTFTIGRIVIYIYIYKSPNLLIPVQYKQKYTPKEVGYLFKSALCTNKLLKEVIIPSQYQSTYNYIVVVIKKEVIQFYNDNISDFYLNFNAVASDIFKTIAINYFPGDVKVYFTTENDRCLL